MWSRHGSLLAQLETQIKPAFEVKADTEQPEHSAEHAPILINHS
jgi:hypothetical protein